MSFILGMKLAVNDDDRLWKRTAPGKPFIPLAPGGGFDAAEWFSPPIRRFRSVMNRGSSTARLTVITRSNGDRIAKRSLRHGWNRR